MVTRFRFVLVAPLFVAAVLVTPQLVGAPYSGPTIASVQPAALIGIPADPGADRISDLNEEVDEVMDVYGNEITAAVATYKIDATGTLYELHSPQTQLPRLASPKS